MFKKAILAGVIALGALASSQAMAAPFSSGQAQIDRMQAEQARMIERGIWRGDLTSYEANRLNDEQRQIKATEWRYKRNGLSRAEISSLKSLLYRAERHIQRELNNENRAHRGFRDHNRNDNRDGNRWNNHGMNRPGFGVEPQGTQVMIAPLPVQPVMPAPFPGQPQQQQQQQQQQQPQHHHMGYR